MAEFFPQAPMLPYYKYSGQGNLYSPRGYAQGTLVDLLSSRKQSDTTDELLEDTVELKLLDIPKLESTRIRTHKKLRTVNINRYILPGKLEPFKLQGDSKRISGDTDRMMKLAGLDEVSDITQN